MFLNNEFSYRLVQVSLFSAIVYYITSYPLVFESARKYFPIKFKKTHHLLIFHTFVFMVLVYFLTYFVFDPIVKVVEGIYQEVDDCWFCLCNKQGDYCTSNSDCCRGYNCHNNKCCIAENYGHDGTVDPTECCPMGPKNLGTVKQGANGIQGCVPYLG
jgi:hypothetical protein